MLQRMRTIWVIRAGVGNSLAEDFRRLGVVGLTVPFPGDASEATSKEIVDALSRSHPVQAPGMAAFLRRLVHDVAITDVVVTPGGVDAGVLVGEITGSYRYDGLPAIPELCHQRSVLWNHRVLWMTIPTALRRALSAPVPIYRPGAQQALSDVLVDGNRPS